jgi:acyl dehydratase
LQEVRLSEPTARKEFTVEQLRYLVGQELGVSEWITVDQQMIDKFADATRDHQWIHVDATKAAAGPYGTTIAHGFLTASLLSGMLGSIYHVTGLSMTVNYGLNRLRFPAPVPSGSRLRTTATLIELTDVVGGGHQSVVNAVVESDTAAKPVCVADVVARLVPLTA